MPRCGPNVACTSSLSLKQNSASKNLKVPNKDDSERRPKKDNGGDFRHGKRRKTKGRYVSFSESIRSPI